MNDENAKADAILNAIPWRCFHCDFITADPAEAAAHFGDRDDPEECKPLCRWWDRLEAGERIQEMQTLVRENNRRDDEIDRQRVAIEGLQFQVDSHESQIRSYKPFRECSSIYEVFCLYDSMEGRAMAAEDILRSVSAPTTEKPKAWASSDPEGHMQAYADAAGDRGSGERL